MELLNRYIHQIGKKLPLKNRADIEKELRSTLEDMLEERSQAAGRPVDEAMAIDLLKSYGAPDKVAASYLPESYLIGPRLYPFFTMVVKIVFAVLTTLAAMGIGNMIANSPLNILGIAKSIWKPLLQYFGGMITAFGNIVLVFAILERVLPASEISAMRDEETEWNPADLMEEPSPDEIGLWEPILAILFSFLAIVVFNLYPQFLSYTPSLNELGSGTVILIPLLADAFFRYLPWLNLIWGLEIALHLALLRWRRWSPAARWFSMGIRVLGIGVLVAMVAGPSLLNFSAEAITTWQMDPDAAQTLSTLFNQLLRWGLVAAVIASGFDLAKDLYRMVTKVKAQ